MSRPAPDFLAPEFRQRVLTQLLSKLDADPRILAVVMVGSTADGFDDEYSDIDLAVVVADGLSIPAVFESWRTQLDALFPLIHAFVDPRGKECILGGFLLQSCLEVDLSFQSRQVMSARSPRWRIAFDRSGEMAAALERSWAQRPPLDIAGRYHARLNSIWYYITHVAVCIRRGQLWRAHHCLQVIRDRALELCCLQHGQELGDCRTADSLPPDRRLAFEATLPAKLTPAELWRALAASVGCFFHEARKLDESLGAAASEPLALAMREYLHVMADGPATEATASSQAALPS